MSGITISGVSRSFGSVRAVDHVDLDVGEGEFFTLLGPSGCGKTTLLRMIAGFCELDAGEIRFGDRRIDQLPAPAPEKPRFWWQVAIAIAVRDVMTVVIVAVGMLRR